MRRFRVSLLLAPIVLLAAIPVRADDKPVMLKRTLKKGDVARMRVESNIDAGHALVTLTAKSTVKDVQDDGTVVLEALDEAGKLHSDGSDMDIPAGPPTTLTFDKVGKLTDFKGGEGGVLEPTILRLLETMRMPILSEKEVHSGDSWETEFDNPAVKGKKFTVKTVYVGSEKIDDAALWKVKQSGMPETDAGGAKMGFDATYWLDPATGQMVRAEVKIKDQPTLYGVHDAVTKLSRIKADAK